MTEHDLIRPGGVSQEGNRITVRAGATFHRDWLLDDFFVEYEGISAESIAPTIATIPFLLNVAPIVWVSGDTYVVEQIDERLAVSLNGVREGFRSLYPDVRWDGEIVARETVANPGDGDPNAVGVLFSGGLDSVCTSMRNAERDQVLVTIRGSDIALDNDHGWSNVKRQVAEYARQFGHANAYVSSNFATFLDNAKLANISPAIPDWWGYAHHGTGLAGLTAPVLIHHDCSALLIGASDTKDFPTPWASHPAIDNQIAWDGVQAFHDSYDWDRQRKLRFVIETCKSRALPPPALRVCYSIPYGSGENCCRCEKCLRTISGLLLEGERPADYGFDTSREEAVRRIRSGFEGAKLRAGATQVYYWNDQKELAREAAGVDDDLVDYRRWLVAFDFDSYRERVERKHALPALAMRTLRQFPAIYNALKRALGRR